MSAVSRSADARASVSRRSRPPHLGLTGLAALAGFVLFACGPRASALELDRVRTIALATSVVKVEAIKRTGGYSLGTAVAVARGRFVTNCHVTREADVVMVVRSGARWRAAGERADLHHDLCLLHVPDLDEVSPIPVATARELRPGDQVAAAGYTGGGSLQLHGGVVSALHALDGSNVIQTTTAFTSGASGGALFDAAGRLVGILTYRMRGAEGRYFAAPVDWVADRIADREGYDPVAPLAGPPPFWAQPVASLPFFMQAAMLEREGKWSDLLGLADRWTAQDANDAEAWLMRANSLVQLGRSDRAVDAYRRCIALSPRFAQAWFELGKASVALGSLEPAREAASVLRELDAGMAEQLAAMIEAARR